MRVAVSVLAATTGNGSTACTSVPGSVPKSTGRYAPAFGAAPSPNTASVT